MPTTANPLEAAKANAIAALVALPVPRMSPSTTPDEIMALSDFLNGLIEAVDPLIAAVGQEFAFNVSGTKYALPFFKDQLLAALDGAALYEIESAAHVAGLEYPEEAAE